MSNLFYLPRVHSEAGAKLYFYATGTSTPQATYQDFDLTTPHANPVVADADGYFDPIYLDPSLVNYRILHTTSADVTIEGPIDDVRPSSSTAGSFTATLTGMSGSVTGTVRFQKMGNFVSLLATSSFSGTSNADTFTMTGLPESIQTTSQVMSTHSYVLNQNTGMLVIGLVFEGVIAFANAGVPAINGFPDAEGFNTTGTKGIPVGWTMMYALA